MEKYIQLMKTLPPLVAAVVWDVVNGRITTNTVMLANETSNEEYSRYNIIRCLVAANPDYPPIEMAQFFVDELLVREKP